MEKIGLIAGNGRFPQIFAENAKRMGLQVIAVAHEGETLPELERYVDKIFWIRVGQLGRLIKAFHRENVTDAVMAGGIKKTRLFSGARPDLRSLILLAKVKARYDDNILRAVAQELEDEGIRMRESTLYLAPILAQKGAMTSRAISKREQTDIQFGWDIAKAIGRHEIGQCVVVKDRVLLAVEAIEGTDETIQRAGRLGGEGAVVIKVSKPNQDLRFDVPAVGPQTIETMKAVRASVLALEVGKTILLDKDLMLKQAEEAKITVLGIEQ
jgi:DUF1009 family protein